MNAVLKEDFKDWMRPALRDYYISKVGYLQQAIRETIPENLTQELLNIAIGKDSNPLTPEKLNDPVYQPMRRYLTVRGKLFRPLICCMFIEGFGKKTERFKPILAIAELIHSCSLILDDIADSSLLRRGNPCSHRIYGIPRAANASSAMTFLTFRLIQSDLLSLDPQTKIRLYEMLLWEHYITSIGSALDLGWAKDKVTEIPRDEYIQHILFRSCSYTYRHAARLGAIVSGADESELKIVYEYSSLIGIAFQFIDDILNLKPESRSWGKITGEDITEGKRSPLMLHALKNAAPGDRARLLEILDGNSSNSSVINECVGILEKYRSFEIVRDQAVAFVEQACNRITKLKITPEFTLLFRDFAHYVVERKM
jgi:geranylgeranyl pyrophosphate synthase